jgi:hypothetical protein
MEAGLMRENWSLADERLEELYYEYATGHDDDIQGDDELLSRKWINTSSGIGKHGLMIDLEAENTKRVRCQSPLPFDYPLLEINKEDVKMDLESISIDLDSDDMSIETDDLGLESSISIEVYDDMC